MQVTFSIALMTRSALTQRSIQVCAFYVGTLIQGNRSSPPGMPAAEEQLSLPSVWKKPSW